jgi:catechol 2,3-dioxygenase-like lactoylglutathione lyase family enzyme
MIDHVSLGTSDLPRALEFYRACLEPLGYSIQHQDAGQVIFGADGAWRFAARGAAAPRDSLSWKYCGQPLRHVHRAVLPAGAAQRHRQVAAVVGLERRQPFLDEIADVGVHFGHSAARSRKSITGASAAGERAQRQVVIGIRQRAHVEHEVGIERHAVLEGERFEEQRQRRLLALATRSLTQARSLFATQFRGIDHMAQLLDRRQDLALFRCIRSACGARPGSAPGRSSCDSGWLRRVSEKRATSECVLAVRNMTFTSCPCSRSLAMSAGSARQRLGAARIDRHGQRFGAFVPPAWRPGSPAGPAADYRRSSKPRVFEDVQRDRFAGAGNTGDKNDAHARMIPVAAHRLALALHEFLQRVDAAQLQDGVAHRGLEQHRDVAAGRDRDHHLADRQAQHVLGRELERQALDFFVQRAARRTRCTISFRRILRRTAVSPKIALMSSRPRPRTSSRFCSSGGQRPFDHVRRDAREFDRVVGHQAVRARSVPGPARSCPGPNRR